MKSSRNAFVASAAAAVLALAGHAGADPISFDRAPLSNIVAQLSQQYGVSIVLKGSLAQKPDQAVTLHVGDIGTTPTRLQAINALANAAGVDFQKGIVVSKIASDETPPPIKIDSNGYVIFKKKTVPASDAIAEVATTDNATIQVSDDVTGDVTFSKATMRTAEAAAEIARQTHTRWRVYYALTPRSMGLRGKVVDRSNGGQPIVELPFTYYGSKTGPTQAVVSANPPNTPGNPALQGPHGNGSIPFSYVPNLGYGGQMPFNYGTGYGYTGYGAPYQSQYGYFGGGNTGGGYNITPGGSNYGPFGSYGAPVTF